MLDAKQAFVANLKILSTAFDRALSADLIDVYWGGLRDLPQTAVTKACTDLVMTGVHFPRISEIRGLIAGRAEDDANEKWAQCTELLSDCRKAKHPDPVVNEVIRQMGGWVHLGTNVKTDNLHSWKSREFRELYRDALELAARHERAGIEDGGTSGMLVGKAGE